MDNIHCCANTNAPGIDSSGASDVIRHRKIVMYKLTVRANRVNVKVPTASSQVNLFPDAVYLFRTQISRW